MLSLVLLRHAKSSWDDPSQEDFDRPLAGRGLSAAPAMGAFMQGKIRPSMVLCSPSRRTRDTLALVADHIGDPPAEYPPELYLATADTLLALIHAVGHAAPQLMIVGHNPGLHTLAVALTGLDKSPGGRALNTKFPTAALAVIDFTFVAWRDIAPETGRLRLFMTPKRLA